MVSAEEIGGVTVFTDLDATERERLSRAAADISLVPGEYAAHEGDERAIFAVVEGRIEAVKTLDGVERVVGERLPGDVFGEVPIVLGTVFPVGFRAAERSRVMRLEAHEYHAVAAVVPDVGKEIAKLAGYRRGGSRGLEAPPAPPPPPRAIVVGHRWDASCAELRRFLDRNQVTFPWLQPDAPDAGHRWGGARAARRAQTLAPPTPRRTAGLLALGTEPREAAYDTVIVGGGPAGLAAAVY